MSLFSSIGSDETDYKNPMREIIAVAAIIIITHTMRSMGAQSPKLPLCKEEIKTSPTNYRGATAETAPVL